MNANDKSELVRLIKQQKSREELLVQDDVQEVEEKEFVKPPMTLPPKLEEVFTLVKAAHVKKRTALDVCPIFFFKSFFFVHGWIGYGSKIICC